MTNQRLADRVAIITGAAGGIGVATARRFIAEGARVVLADMSHRRLAALAEELGDMARPVNCDVSIPCHVERAVKAAVDELGRLDIVFNNAAIGSSKLLAEIEEHDWIPLLQVNIGGVINGTRYGAEAMRKHGGGVILNMSSIAAHQGMTGLGVYGACKAAIESLTRTAARELKRDNIRVNAIVPGFIRTASAEAAAGALGVAVGTELDTWIATHQVRWGEPEEVAAIAVHLASDEASFTSGHMYHIDNGAGFA